MDDFFSLAPCHSRLVDESQIFGGKAFLQGRVGI